MYNILAITNRKLCTNSFLSQIEKICIVNNKLKDKNCSITIILREKDLSQNEYKNLARKVLEICNAFNTKCILHTFYDVAKELKCKEIHLPLNILKDNPTLINDFNTIGVSVHSKHDAKYAEDLGATYITAGHIFNTNCKRGIPGRGLDFLKEIVDTVTIPVYGIGGINKNNLDKVFKVKAYGACIMSGFMTF